jgi:oxygen-dependent protoporphyrinogen oxidase
MRVAVAVVGGGITGLAAAHRLLRRLGPGSVALIEAEPRLGGKIHTVRREGFLLEAGPDAFLTSKPGGTELCRELGLTDELIGANPTMRRSFVKRAGRLHELPDGLSGLVPTRITSLLTSGLLSFPGRARAGLELLVPRRTADGEESVASFARRRFGREAYDWLIEPLLSGIYAGDGHQLSLDATFPQLRDLERRQGSLLRHLSVNHRRSAAPRSGFVTLRDGLGTLVETLGRHLGGELLLTGRAVQRLEAAPFGYRLVLRDGTSVEAERVVLAVPARAAAVLLRPHDGELAVVLESFPAVSTATVSVGFPREAIPHPLPGYGYLSPRAAGGPIVACTWTTNKFAERAPEGRVLLRCFVGRAGEEDPVHAGEGALLAVVRAELAEVLGIVAEPVLHLATRWPRGMPQYTLGHGGRVAEVEQRVARLPGVFLAGASYHGVGIPDCITSGWTAADRALRGLGVTGP